jgi:imidazolonepropionase-like amidohydrolase
MVAPALYAPPMTDRVLIQTASLLDVDAGSWRSGQRLLVDRDGRIEAVLGPDDATPADARPLELGETWVVPGLIDCHSHQVGDMEYAGVPATTTSAAEEAMTGVRNARTTLAAGFTSVRDVGTFRAFVDVALRDAIDAGWTPGPRMQCAGAYVTAPGGAGDVTGLAHDVVLPADLRFGVVRTPAEVREKVRAIVGGGADLIKILVTGAVLTRGTQVGAVELDTPMIEAAVDQATALGVFVAAHAHGTEGIKLAIRGGVRSVEHASLIDDEGIDLLVRHGTFLVADVYDGDWIAEEGARAGWPAETMAKNELTTQAQRDGFTKAVAAGANIAFGTDSGVYPHGRNAIQFGYQVRLGQTPLEALRSATTSAAGCMGWSDRVGSVAPGQFADLVALPADPLADIEVLRRPVAVVKGGALVG